MEDRIYELAAGYCEGRLSKRELRELEALLRTDGRARRIFTEIRQMDRHAKACAFPRDHERAWKRIEGRLAGNRIRGRRMRLAAAAASAACVALAILLLVPKFRDGGAPQARSIPPAENKAMLRLGDGRTIQLSEGISPDSLDNLLACKAPAVDAPCTITVARGGKYAFTLPDGSRVWLNSDSQISFPSDFSGAERAVQIRGEAFLEVAHDAQHPFIVDAGGGRIRVLGTRFNVSAYPEEGHVVTTLVEGSVEFRAPGGRAVLSPGEQSLWNRRDERFETRKVDIALYTSWVEGVFEFESMPMRQIALQLARWYDVEITFDRDAEYLGEYLFTGVTDRNANLEDILSKIAETTRMDFDVRGRTIVIHSK